MIYRAHNIPEPEDRGKTIEEQRLKLRQAYQKAPDNPNIKRALARLMTTEHVRLAAKQGVFISYSRADDLFVLDLALDLREAGVDVWIDMTDIPDDADWRREVSRALRRCGVLLMVVSPATVDDEDVKAERQHFINSGKVIIPILYQNSDHKDDDLWINPVDFRYDYRTALQNLHRLLVSPSEVEA